MTEHIKLILSMSPDVTECYWSQNAVQKYGVDDWLHQQNYCFRWECSLQAASNTTTLCSRGRNRLPAWKMEILKLLSWRKSSSSHHWNTFYKYILKWYVQIINRNWVHSCKKVESWIQVVFPPKLGKLRQDKESWRRLGKLRQIRKVHPKDQESWRWDLKKKVLA